LKATAFPKHGNARQVLGADQPQLSPSTLISFCHKNISGAELEEFLKSAPRVPAGMSDDSDGLNARRTERAKDATKGAELFFDLDGANAFNKRCR